MPIQLDTQVRYLKGVGPNRGEDLIKAGLEDVEALLRHKPIRYEDRTNFKKIRDLSLDEEVVIQGRIIACEGRKTYRKRMHIFQVIVEDETGHLPITFFNQPYLENVLTKDRQVVVFGQTRFDDYGKSISMANPEFEILEGEEGVHTGRIVPIYRRVGQLTSRTLRQIIYRLLADVEDPLPDSLPHGLIERYRFPGRSAAFRQMHFPECPPEKALADFLEELSRSRTPAQQRFIFEEFFEFQLGLQLVRHDRESATKDRKLKTGARVRETLKSVLPFHPTDAQRRVLKEIIDDLRSREVMSRLLQGDVGSGKTIVALQALLVVLENGYQAALMAPTELLAEQHFKNIARLIGSTRFKAVLLTGRAKGKERSDVLERIKTGRVDLIIGTHALIQKKVEFHNLAFAVVDEQHRFGVMQRSELMQKGSNPDVLVMTATPIPRSLALTVYGDLELSVLDELPPGRQPVRTLLVSERKRESVYKGLERQLKEGRQIYVVYPLIEESEKLDLKAATEMSDHLRRDVFPRREVGLLHGKLDPESRDDMMRRFSAGEIDVLVSTTVIEVGIDVPNASVMVIENAERFGLSQLHQLRGRIGRGPHASFCILMMSGPLTAEARERLEIMRETQDGFRIAEKDLEIRGPGEFVGTRQSGVPTFHFGNIVRDREWLELARREAQVFVKDLLKRTDSGHRASIREIRKAWSERYGLYKVG